MKVFLLICLNIAYLKPTDGQKQHYEPVSYAVEGKSVSLPCAVPSSATFLKWVFHRNGTEFSADAAQVFPGKIPSVFTPFNSPSDRAEMKGGDFVIHEIYVTEEGDYWCEISFPSVPTVKSTKYPIHVYVTPQNPQVTSLGNNTLTEYKNSTVARCASQGGKPGANLIWMNGSTPMSSSQDIVYKQNAFKDYLTDGDVDLRIYNPTRYDHKRIFSCVIEHPAYEERKVLNYSVFVMYHPVNIRVWANLTSLYVYCEAEGYPDATYHWVMPGGLTGFTGPSLFVQDLLEISGYESFECIASNGIPPNATVRVNVDDLRYPDGKPGLLGLDWWVWGAIIGGVVALIIIVVIIIICIRRRNKTPDKKKATKYLSPVKKPVQSTDHGARQPPTSLRVDMSYRTPDGREDSFDSRTPSPVNEHKRALIGGVFSKSQENVTLIPSEELRRSRENMYSDNRKSMHASTEQLDVVASHIQTLNKSWDQLSKSRQALNDTQDELEHTRSSLQNSREHLYHSQEALNRDTDQNYPYIDEGTQRSRDNYPTYDDRNQDQHDGYRREPQGYDSSDRDRYDQRQGYRSSGYGDRQQGYDGYDRRDERDRYRDDHGRGENYNGYNQESSGADRGYNYGDGRQDYYRDDGYDQGDHYDTTRIV